MPHTKYLLMALAKAEKYRGFCSPNPSVGAVVVSFGQVVATGYHEKAGAPHAEVIALNEAGDKAKGATLYVTLEPCCHFGKTPPCTESIKRAGIHHVVFGHCDRNPKQQGCSVEHLKSMGIDCLHYPLPEITAFYRSYDYWQTHKRPWMTAKIAMSLDGKIAGEEGQPVAITGEALKTFTHQKRRQSDALLTTVNTIINDDPRFDVRLDKQTLKKPLFVIDSQLRLPNECQIEKTTQSITVFHREDVHQERICLLEERGIHCVALPAQGAHISLSALINYLGQKGLHDVWVEMGGRCLQAFLNHDCLQTLYIYLGVMCLGEKALSAFQGEDHVLSKVSTYHWQLVGNDVLCVLNLHGRE